MEQVFKPQNEYPENKQIAEKVGKGLRDEKPDYNFEYARHLEIPHDSESSDYENSIDEIKSRIRSSSDVVEILESIDKLYGMHLDASWDSWFENHDWKEDAERLLGDLHPDNYFADKTIEKIINPSRFISEEQKRRILDFEWEDICHTMTDLVRSRLVGKNEAERKPGKFTHSYLVNTFDPLKTDDLDENDVKYFLEKYWGGEPVRADMAMKSELRRKYQDIEFNRISGYDSIGENGLSANDIKDGISSDWCGRLGDNYGVVYAEDGSAMEFCRISGEGMDRKMERMPLEKILEAEGYSRAKAGDEAFNRVCAVYQRMAGTELRELTETEFGIRIEDYSIREQAQFVNFLSSKTTDEVEAVKAFLDQAPDESARRNRVKSFLSLESGEVTGGDILIIGKALEDMPGAADLVFRKFQELAGKTRDAAQTKLNLLEGNRDLSKEEIEKIVDGLMAKANGLLSAQAEKIKTDGGIDFEALVLELKKIDGQVELLSQIVKNISRDEVANLDLRKISEIEKIEGMPASELAANPELLEKILVLIDDRMPAGDREVFLKEIESNPDQRITATMVNGEVLCFFTSKNREGDVAYLDWLIANKEAPIEGLAEATIKLEFRRPEAEGKKYYAVAKPHVKSFYMLVEKLGFVAFEGSTIKGEYKHYYARCRRLSVDNKLVTKNLSENHEKILRRSLKANCSDPNKTANLLFNGHLLYICKTAYHRKTSDDDIPKEDDDGWLMQEIDRQYEKGYILTRYIPGKRDKESQEYYAVFEQNLADEKEEAELRLAYSHAAAA